jgi:chromosomal replication initiator protein
MSNQEVDDVRLLKSTKEIWAATQDLLSKKLSQPSFESWIRPAQLLSIDNGEATIAVKNEFMRTMISGNHLESINAALAQVTKTTLAVKIIVDAGTPTDNYVPTIASISIIPDNQAFDRSDDSGIRSGAYMGSFSPSGPPSGSSSAMATAYSKSNLSSKYNFNTFVVGSHNRFCHSAALAVAMRPGHAYNPLFLYGGVGLGKTHIMQAIGHEILRISPQTSVRYISCERFTNELINSIRDDRMMDFRKRYRQVDVLLVDDIQFIQGKESTQEEFFHTFNALRDSGRQIVLSSDRPPKAISLLEERLKSRFEQGLIADIQVPDLETRVAILRKKCEVDRIQVPDEVLEHIATVFTANIRELEGALIRAHAYANMTGTALTVQALAEIIQPSEPNKPKVTLTLDYIIECVSQHYRIEPSEMRSTKRSQDLALPRHVAMYLAHEIMQMSFPRIGQAFANRKHTSALYAYSRVKDALPTDPTLAAAVRTLTKKLGS